MPGLVLNRTLFRATSNSTGSFVVSAAITGYQTPAQAGGVDSSVYSYYAESDDLSQWEVGRGTLSSSGTTLSRTVQHSSTGGTVNFLLPPKVGIAPVAEAWHSIAEGRIITPSALTASVNDYAPTGYETASIIRVDGNADGWSITGLAGGADGRVVYLSNISAANGINIPDQSASSAAGNRFDLVGSAAWIDPGMTLGFYYDGTLSRWHPLMPTYTWAGSSTVEAGTSFYYYVSPATQHRHPSAAKAWGQVTGGGTAVLGVSYNMTSITDGATGNCSLTIATDFSSANWAGTFTCVITANANRMVSMVTKAAGTVSLETASATSTRADAGIGFDWVMFGDQ